MSDRSSLSPREEQVLNFIEAGKTVSEVAAELGLSRSSVGTYLARARTKMELDDPEVAREDSRNNAIMGLEVEQDGGDHQIISAKKRGETPTLEWMLEQAGVSVDEWEVTKWVTNMWETQFKGEVIPLWQAKAWLERLPRWLLNPIKAVKSLPRTPNTKSADGLERCLILPDAQIGFRFNRQTNYYEPLHDRLAMDCALSIVQESQPEVIVVIGDWLDFAAFSDKYRVKPEYRHCSQPALLETYWWLRQIRQSCPSAQIIYTEGNHEERLTRQIVDKMNEASNLRAADRMGGPPALSVPTLLSLDSLDIEWVPYKEDWWFWGVRFTHDVALAQGGGASVAKALKTNHHSVVFGHTHRAALAFKTVHGPEGMHQIFGLNPGCLCRNDGAVPAVKPQVDWQHGVGEIIKFPDGKLMPRLHMIHHGRSVVRGRIHVGRDRADEIAKDVSWPMGKK